MSLAVLKSPAGDGLIMVKPVPPALVAFAVGSPVQIAIRPRRLLLQVRPAGIGLQDEPFVHALRQEFAMKHKAQIEVPIPDRVAV